LTRKTTTCFQNNRFAAKRLNAMWAQGFTGCGNPRCFERARPGRPLGRVPQVRRIRALASAPEGCFFSHFAWKPPSFRSLLNPGIKPPQQAGARGPCGILSPRWVEPIGFVGYSLAPSRRSLPAVTRQHGSLFPRHPAPSRDLKSNPA
jgi:hypothetical protein